jgi:Mrp family chromosome partitioning ATPase
VPSTKQFVAPNLPENARATVAMAAVVRDEVPRAGAAVEIEVFGHAELPPPQRLDERAIVAREPSSERAASFRVLRHHLIASGDPRVIVVSSPEDGQGKTTCALNLALALGECGRSRVLLVEANSRHPTLADIFRFAPPTCFLEQLGAHRERPERPWRVVDITPLGIHVLAIDPAHRREHLLDAPGFALAMDTLRRADYDHLIIDAPSILGSADVNLMQDAADGVLLTVQRKTCTARLVRQSVEQLAPSHILGTVLIE